MLLSPRGSRDPRMMRGLLPTYLTGNITIRRLFTFLAVVPFVSSAVTDVVNTVIETSAFTIVQTRRRFTLIIHYIYTLKYCTKAIVVIITKHGRYIYKNNATMYA